ncbi:D-alanyl-D-alanine carboxypeptidase [Clostridiaceae bacterium M8S5]|nr:D-alanyl-D-alanine carboxypeptidase [Clostridiaceae bacterium M8S5]
MKTKKIISLLIIISILTITISTAKSNNVNVSSQSSILMERYTGRVLYAQNSNKKLPMASTTKIMTALVALEYGHLNEMVNIHPKSIGVEGSSIYLKHNEKIPLIDLIYGLMLRSGNDAATAIAYHIGKSIDGFVALMNYKAKELGAKNTNFTNPHGLHHDSHYTTAYDLALITRAAMNNEEFKKISKTRLYVSNGSIKRYFYNKNKTLWQFDGGDGGKTGYTKTAGRCLVSTATRNGMQLISVVLNDGNWFNDCYNLMSYGFEKYSPNVILQKNQFIKNITVQGGKQDYTSVVNSADIILPLTEEEQNDIKLIFDIPNSVKAPLTKKTKIGTAKVFLKGELICLANLYPYRAIAKKSAKDKLIDFIYNIFD